MTKTMYMTRNSLCRKIRRFRRWRDSVLKMNTETELKRLVFGFDYVRSAELVETFGHCRFSADLMYRLIDGSVWESTQWSTEEVLKKSAVSIANFCIDVLLKKYKK